MKGQKFTDRQLQLFYVDLLRDYKNSSEKLNNNIYDIYNEMFNAVEYAIENPNGVFYSLDRTEKDNVYHYFNSLFYSLPIYTGMSAEDRKSFNPKPNRYNPYTIIITHRKGVYENDSFVINWLLLNSLTHHCHYRHDRTYPYPSPSNRHGHPSNHDNNSRKNESKEDIGQALALLVVIFLAAIAAVATFIALAYMLNEFLDSCERFYFNEGWLKAALMLASAAGFGASTSILSLTFGSIPLIALALAAGLNPIGVVIVGTVCLSVIGAAIGTFAMGMFYDFVDSKVNSDAMDPKQSARFRLTASEEQALVNKNIDPAMVKLALIALRAEIAHVLDKDKDKPSSLWRTLGCNRVDNDIPSFLWRKIGSGSEVSDLLTKVRQLRSGQILSLKVGELYFNLAGVPKAVTQQNVTKGQEEAVPTVTPAQSMQAIPVYGGN